MSDETIGRLEEKLIREASQFSFPPTPDIASSLKSLPRSRRVLPARMRLAWALLALVFICASMMLVPPVRAQIVEVIQLGVVRIFLVEATQTPTPSLTPTPMASTGLAGDTITQTPLPTRRVTPTQTPEFVQMISLFDLDGKTTLADARQRFSYPIRLPAYPDDIGEPDHVFVQDLGTPVVILIWMDPANPETILFSLHLFGPGSYTAEKSAPVTIDETLVNGDTAFWTTGPYLVRLANEDIILMRLVEGHVLIWYANGITYRLESNLTLAEARRIAESLSE